MNTHNPIYFPLNEGSLADRVMDLMLVLREWEPTIKAALKHAHGTHNFDDICAGVINGQLELWSFDDCFALTEVKVFPQTKQLHFFLAGGDMESMFAKIPFFKQVAKDRGCSKLSLSGREGWVRAGLKHGWKNKIVTLQMEIEQ